MHLLLESHDTRTTPLGVAISLVVHAVLGIVVIAAYRQGADENSLLNEFASYLVPIERVAGWQGDPFVNFDPGQKGDGKKPTEKGAGGLGAPGGTGEHSPAAGDTANSTQLRITLPSIIGDSILTEIEVDSAVKRHEWSASPDYPIRMLQQNIEGAAFVTYVVDTLGIADTASLKVVRATHDEFAEAVRDAMPKMRFRPAILSGQKVRQLVQQNFTFKIQRPDSVLPPIVKPPS